ncbi:MAG: hypothetical protein WDZ96_00170 [Acidimicrobiia bacterium]
MQPPKGWKPPVPVREIDSLLELWVYWANTAGIEASVTLHVGGSLIQGTVISSNNWLDILAKEMKEGNSESPELLDLIAETFERLRDSVQVRHARDTEELDVAFSLAKVEADEKGDDPDGVPPPDRESFRYIHLKDTTIRQGNAWFEPGIFRVDLRSVDGWTLGTF